MDKRFGVKDFFLFSLLTVLIVIVLMGMVQFDRQWGEVQKLQGQLRDQGKDLQAIQRTLERPINVNVNVQGGGSGTSVPGTNTQTRPSTTASNSNDTSSGGEVTDGPFARIMAARKMAGFANGDWVVESFSGQMATVTPLIASDVYARYIHDLTLETLLTRDPMTLEWQPLLASSWKVEDKSAEFEEYVAKQKAAGKKDVEIDADPKLPIPVIVTYKIRPQARFSDGTPVTAEDFIWTFNWTMNEKVNAARDRSAMEKIRSVEKGPNGEVIFKFKEPYYNVLTVSGSLYALPKHFYEGLVSGPGGEQKFNDSVGWLLGSGPYRLESPTNWKPGSGQVVLVRNERYWAASGPFDRLVFKEIALDTVRQTAFRNGEIDLFEARPEQYDKMRQDTELMKRSQAHDILSLNGGYRFVAWQQLIKGKPTPFADKRVRQAMAMLINRERMVKEVMLGYAELATGPYSPAGKQIDLTVNAMPYDVNRAIKLLEEAGFKDRNNDGVIDGPDGKPFKFKLTYPSGSPNYEKMVLGFKDAYAKAGIILEQDPLDWSVFSSKLRNKEFEAITLGWGGGDPESDIYQMFHSKWTQPAGDNFMCYINPKLDAVLDKARRTVDEKTRMPLWHEAHRIIADDQPYMFMWFIKDLYMVDKRIQNFQLGPLGMPQTVKLEWYVPSAQQKWKQ